MEDADWANPPPPPPQQQMKWEWTLKGSWCGQEEDRGSWSSWETPQMTSWPSLNFSSKSTQLSSTQLKGRKLRTHPTQPSPSGITITNASWCFLPILSISFPPFFDLPLPPLFSPSPPGTRPIVGGFELDQWQRSLPIDQVETVNTCLRTSCNFQSHLFPIFSLIFVFNWLCFFVCQICRFAKNFFISELSSKISYKQLKCIVLGPSWVLGKQFNLVDDYILLPSLSLWCMLSQRQGARYLVDARERFPRQGVLLQK